MSFFSLSQREPRDAQNGKFQRERSLPAESVPVLVILRRDLEDEVFDYDVSHLSGRWLCIG